MAIRELSQERRNMMIPRYWRDAGELYWPAPYWFNIAAGAWRNSGNLTTGVYTFEESSKWKVYCEGRFEATGVTNNWIAAAVRITYNLNAAGWVTLTENTGKWDAYYDNNAHNARRVSISNSWKRVFAFIGPEDTIQFRMEWYISASTATLNHPELLIEVARD